TVTAYRAAGFGIEAADVTIYRSDASGLVQVAGTLGHIHGRSTGKGHIALIGHYRSGSRMNSSQRGGTCSLDVQAGAAQVKAVRDSGGQMVLFGATDE